MTRIVRPPTDIQRGMLETATFLPGAATAPTGRTDSCTRTTSFSTHALPRREQLDAWRGWFDGVYDVDIPSDDDAGFVASSEVWLLDGASFARVAAPALRAKRPRHLIQRNPVDHWVIGLGNRAPTRFLWRDRASIVPAGIPFVSSLADDVVSEREADDRLHLYLPRDRFSHLAPTLDAARGVGLEGPSGHLLADYLMMLDRHLPHVDQASLPRLTEAIGVMVAACIRPSSEHAERAGEQIDVLRLERARQVIRRNFRSARLGPEMLCRELGMSRSQLYRLFRHQGGVAHYIQQCRLRAAHAALTDPSNHHPVAAIAEEYGFYDASAFSRAFRRAFGSSPTDARASGAPARSIRPAGPGNSLIDCLRSY
ncbi:MAG: helix-turn-helix domain-containing protein [Acetobacteraceae bacterium]|nr:helix-turn-helix domain-containing protein [Acetobacteraceae bacterium]